MHSVIYSTDNLFQVITFVKGNSDKAWILANEMARNGNLKSNNIEGCNVIQFKSIELMNEWILNQVKESRIDNMKYQGMNEK